MENHTLEDLDELERWEQNQWKALQQVFNLDTSETIAETATAYITRAQYRGPPHAVAVAIKTASIDPKITKQPHDIGKELRILSSISHTNIIEVLGHTHEPTSSTVHYWMPFVPIHVADILSNPRFSPHAYPGVAKKAPDPATFLIVAKSVAFQTLSALEHLHERGIAHRDVKPRNLLLTLGGRVQLIDFGVAWSEEPNNHDLWPEPRGSMCVDVSTGPYRAPELLFGATDYDAYATDLWSLGAVLAEFFTPMRLLKTDDEDDWYVDDEDINNSEEATPFIIPKGLSPTDEDVEWMRDSLFDGNKGQLGLAWSIFRTFGTPTYETWPTFKELPDAQKVTFVQVPPSDMIKLLPNLPPTDLEEHNDFFDVVVNLLLYPPDSRLRASIALKHLLFKRGLPVLLPTGYPAEASGDHPAEWKGRGLGGMLSQCLD